MLGERPVLRVLVLVAAVASAAGARAASRLEVLYAEPVEIAGVATPAAHAARPGPATARFDAYGRRFELELANNDRIVAGLAARRGAAAVYRGTLAGTPGSWVRLTVTRAGERHGLVWDGRDLYVIGPAAAAGPQYATAAATRGRTLVYRLADTIVPAGASFCGVVAAADGPPLSGLEAYRTMLAALAPPVAAAGGAPTQRLQVAVLGDFEYGQANGIAPATDKIIARFNNIDGIFSAQVGVQIEVSSIAIFDSAATQPFSGTDANTLLTQLGTYRSGQAAQQAAGLTHLVTGRSLDGTTVGIAYIGTLCDARYGASLSEGQNGFADLIAAHEIGHNFGAPHDGETPAAGQPANPCQSTPQTYLMAPRVNGSSTFSACSLAQMQPVIARATCLLPAVSIVDVGVSATAPPRALVGHDVTIAASVANGGAHPATDATLSVAVPAGLTPVGGSAAQGGTCTAAATEVNCSWTDLPAGASAAVTLTVHAASTGNYTLAAATTASGDSNSANDSTSIAVGVDPLPALALTAPASASATVGAAVTLAASVTNPGAATVDGASVTIAVPATLKVGSATVSGSGSCSGAAPTLTCSVPALAGGTHRTVTLNATASSAGAGTVTFTLLAADDASPNDNVGAVAVTVTAAAPPPASSSSGGGGGSFGAGGLAALAALALARRRRGLLQRQQQVLRVDVLAGPHQHL